MSRTPRMFGWLLLALILLAVIAVVNPHQLPLALYKLSLIALAAVVGYWLDRSLFPYSRPDGYLNTSNWLDSIRFCGKRESAADLSVAKGYEHVFSIAMLRRALIVGACILGVALGL